MSAAQTTRVMPSAGWYPDPAQSAMLRYWDGRSWTQRLAPPSSATEPKFEYAPDGTVFRVHQYA